MTDNKDDSKRRVYGASTPEGEKSPDGRPVAKPEQHPASRANLLKGNEGVVAARAAKASYLALREGGATVEEAAEQLQLSKATTHRYEKERLKGGKDSIMSQEELARTLSGALRDKKTPPAYRAPLANALAGLQGYTKGRGGNTDDPHNLRPPRDVREWLSRGKHEREGDGRIFCDSCGAQITSGQCVMVLDGVPRQVKVPVANQAVSATHPTAPPQTTDHGEAQRKESDSPADPPGSPPTTNPKPIRSSLIAPQNSEKSPHFDGLGICPDFRGKREMA